MALLFPSFYITLLRTVSFLSSAVSDPCSPNPCENGGVCSPNSLVSSDYQCTCPDGYTGDTCGEIRECTLASFLSNLWTMSVLISLGVANEYAVTQLYLQKPLGKIKVVICNYQVDSPFYSRRYVCPGGLQA